MRKELFFTGLIFQVIHLFGFLILMFSTIDWSFLTEEFFMITFYIIFNLITFGMMWGGLRE